MLKGTTNSSVYIDCSACGRYVAAAGVLNYAGWLTVSETSSVGRMAMTRYCPIVDSVCYAGEVETSAAVAGKFGSACGERAWFDVTATDAGTNCGVDGGSAGDADPLVVV